MPPRVVVTGASGVIGRLVCADLSVDHDVVGVDRRAPRGSACRRLDVRDRRRLRRVLAGTDAIVELAGNPSVAASWDTVRDENVSAAITCFDLAAELGVRRVVYASSNHVTGGYERDEPWASVVDGRYEGLDPVTLPRISSRHPPRPDSPYAVGKCFAEMAGHLAAEQHGVSVVCLRIGHVTRTDRPENVRDFSVFLSARDLTQLVRRALAAPSTLRWSVVYGVSANTWRIWDLAEARDVLGFRPVDDAEAFRGPVARPQRPPARDWSPR